MLNVFGFSDDRHHGYMYICTCIYHRRPLKSSILVHELLLQTVLYVSCKNLDRPLLKHLHVCLLFHHQEIFVLFQNCF